MTGDQKRVGDSQQNYGCQPGSPPPVTATYPIRCQQQARRPQQRGEPSLKNPDTRRSEDQPGRKALNSAIAPRGEASMRVHTLCRRVGSRGGPEDIRLTALVVDQSGPACRDRG